MSGIEGSSDISRTSSQSISITQSTTETSDNAIDKKMLHTFRIAPALRLSNCKSDEVLKLASHPRSQRDQPNGRTLSASLRNMQPATTAYIVYVGLSPKKGVASVTSAMRARVIKTTAYTNSSEAFDTWYSAPGCGSRCKVGGASRSQRPSKHIGASVITCRQAVEHALAHRQPDVSSE